MMIKTFGSAVYGISAQCITVEVDIGQGAKTQLIGLPDNAVRESLTRIYGALKNCGLSYPRRGIIINMAPADIRKEGSAYDLTIAVGILAASNQVPPDLLSKIVIMGELSLDGSILPIRGGLPIALQARDDNFHSLVLPKPNAQEACIVSPLKVYGLSSLTEVVAFLTNPVDFQQETYKAPHSKPSDIPSRDFSDVKGQLQIKRAMEVAAAGGHNIILIGPPGAGKTMLAKRLHTILPPMTLNEALESTKIHSVAGRLGHHTGMMTERPFRSPHHTISDVALVGGGNHPQPGEISLAHHGVLFLDELPEFKRAVLEVLRQPLEDRKIAISRAKFSVEYPSSFMLVASMNPCPCGFFNHPHKECVCAPGTVQRYLNRISGPLLDRIDLHIEVTPVSFDALKSASKEEASSAIHQRVVNARVVQNERFASSSLHCNAQMESQQIRKHCALSPTASQLIRDAMNRLNLSARAYDRILKVSRTIADLAASPHITTDHLAEAIHYRSLDREGWGSG